LSPSSGKAESSLRNTVLKRKQDGALDKDRKLDNVQKRNICITVTSSQTFRSSLLVLKCKAYDICILELRGFMYDIRIHM
jgi:hypothetical protein